MTTLRTAAQQALEFIKATNASSSFWLVPESNLNKTVKALRVALEQPEQKAECDGGTCGLGGYCDECPKRQPEQEPVAWMWEHQLEDLKHYGFLPNMRAWTTERRTGNFERLMPVYTHPPRREWRGLTEEEIMGMTRTECIDMRWPSTALNIARAIEAALKEKNQ